MGRLIQVNQDRVLVLRQRRSQLAIECSHRIEEQFPKTCLFWVHASNTDRLEEVHTVILDSNKYSRRTSQRLTSSTGESWLGDEANGRWILILSDVDDLTMCSYPPKFL